MCVCVCVGDEVCEWSGYYDRSWHRLWSWVLLLAVRYYLMRTGIITVMAPIDLANIGLWRRSRPRYQRSGDGALMCTCGSLQVECWHCSCPAACSVSFAYYTLQPSANDLSLFVTMFWTFLQRLLRAEGPNCTKLRVLSTHPTLYFGISK